MTLASKSNKLILLKSTGADADITSSLPIYNSGVMLNRVNNTQKITKLNLNMTTEHCIACYNIRREMIFGALILQNEKFLLATFARIVLSNSKWKLNN